MKLLKQEALKNSLHQKSDVFITLSAIFSLTRKYS